jgi:parallel beta-helix repeat protein
LINNTLVDNGGYALYLNSSAPTIQNCVAAFNRIGIVSESAGAFVLKNNCVYGNTQTDYSDVDKGTHDINSDPLFVNRAQGDYHLAPNSPCIDAGDSSDVDLSWIDLDGEARIMNSKVDIGADEYNTPGTSYATPDGFVHTGWNLVSFPGIPVNADPTAVFQGLDLNQASLQYWKNTDGGGWQSYGSSFNWTGPIELGIPYWFLISDSNLIKSLSFTGNALSSDFKLSIPAHTSAPYWIMLGNPFNREISCDNLLFTNSTLSSDSKNWEQAVALKWVESKAQGFNNATQQFFTAGPLTYVPDRTNLQPWYGYWLLIDRPEAITITIPKS